MKLRYILTTFGIFIIGFGVLFLLMTLKPDFFIAKENIIEINNQVSKLNNQYEITGAYDITKYEKVSFIPVKTLAGEIYAELVPENYYSSVEYNSNSYELESLLYIEDKTFLFRNLSFSLKGLARAIIKIHTSGKKQGGSGITQQLVKNIVIDDSRSTISRKYKELIVSYYIDRQFSRLEIVNSYLNRISYGKNIYGIQQAGELYLGKLELSLEECFFLNSLLKQPTVYYKNQDKLKERAKYYMERYLRDNGYSEEEVLVSLKQIDNLELRFINHNRINGTNEYLRDKSRSFSAKNNLNTIQLNYNIPLNKEKKITELVSKEEDRLCIKYSICDIGVVVLNKEGYIEFLYGGNYTKSQVDATSSLFELGSTLKPFLYAQYFDIFGIKTSVNNNLICIDTYCPENWNKKSGGFVSMNTALNLSYNLPVIHIIKESISLKSFYTLLKALGLYHEEEPELNASMVLGTRNSSLFKLTNTYLSLIDGNYEKIEIFGTKRNEKKRIFKEESVKYIRDILLNNGLTENYSIKTGTSSEFKEHYIMGINDNRVIGIWLGNKNGDKTKPGVYSISKGGDLFNIISGNLDL